jgi:hypothetical protein
MGRALPAIIGLALAGGVALAVFARLSAPPDVPAPATFSSMLEPARDMAAHKAGVAVVVLPLHLVEVGCSPDGRSAALAFETALTSERLYGVIGMPPAEEVDNAGAVTTIVGLTSSEFAAERFEPPMTSACP